MNVEWYYLVILVILGLLAIADIVVGVSNDAVNFLSSAVGSRAASFKVIMVIAGLGVVIGAVFSSGMMEVARKGIFLPEKFVFSDIMIIFLAVMLSLVILIDFFNTFGLPTSTTVSLVFALLGGAVAVSIIKIIGIEGNISDLGSYINTEKALAIIFGILISVVVAFIAGAIIQYIVRMIFTFNYKKNVKYTSGIFGGFALTAILLFIVLKGLHDSSIIGKEGKAWVEEHTLLISLTSMVVLSILLQLLHMIFKLNVFKVVVLFGTFGLALSFAGNDLVNFIGAPMAALKSFQLWQASGADPDTFNMVGLKGEIPTDVYLLLAAGLIMVVTIFMSKKARTVVETTLQLSRQDEGEERWGSSLMARALVKGAVSFHKGTEKLFPKSMTGFMTRRFEKSRVIDNSEEGNQLSFDLIRASVNLVVASILIAFATSLKLPLSTTYVTFMVAMGSSLSDRAWGRESAVFRITGVLTVISGWFFTAFIAFVVAAIIAVVLYYGGIVGVVIMVLISIYLLYRSNVLHKSREQENEEAAEATESFPATPIEFAEATKKQTLKIFEKIPEIYSKTIQGLEQEDRKLLKKLVKEVNQLNKQTKKYKNRSVNTVKNLGKELLLLGSHSVQINDYIRETAYCLNYITIPSFTHVNNVHNPIPEYEFKELNIINKKISNIINQVNIEITNDNLSIQNVKGSMESLMSYIDEKRRSQLQNINEIEMNTRTTLLYLGIMHETRNMLIHMEHFVKSYEEFLKDFPKE